MALAEGAAAVAEGARVVARHEAVDLRPGRGDLRLCVVEEALVRERVRRQLLVDGRRTAVLAVAKIQQAQAARTLVLIAALEAPARDEQFQDAFPRAPGQR